MSNRISAMIAENDLLDCLGSEDLNIINEAKECISAAYTVGIGSTSDANKRFNSMCQSDMANLTARVFDTWKTVSLSSKKKEGDLLEDGDADGYKTEKEREAVLLSVCDSYYDMRTQESRLEALYNYCNTLSWSLTASAKV